MKEIILKIVSADLSWSNNSINVVSGFSNPYFTKGDSASGAPANYLNESITSIYAVFSSTSTSPIKSKTANSLGLYDMCGNFSEWTLTSNGTDKIARGGNYSDSAGVMALGCWTSYSPSTGGNLISFRLTRRN